MDNEIVKPNLRKTFVDSLFYKSPILSLFMGLTLAVIATTRVQIALIISLIVCVDLIFSNLIISLFRKNLTRITSYILDTIISAGIAMIAEILFDKLCPGFLNASESKYSIVLFAVIPFIATNSIAIEKCRDDLSRSISETLVDACGSAISFTVLLVLISVIREVLSSGAITFVSAKGNISQLKLFDTSKFSISVMAKPFGGILLCGLFTGLHLTLVKLLSKKDNNEEAI